MRFLQFHINLAREKWIGVYRLNQTKRQDCTINKPKKDNDQTLTLRTNSDKCLREKGHKSFKVVLYFQINKVTIKVNDLRKMKRDTKDKWNRSISNYHDSWKIWKLRA